MNLLRRPNVLEQLVHVHGAKVLPRTSHAVHELVERQRVHRRLPREGEVPHRPPSSVATAAASFIPEALEIHIEILNNQTQSQPDPNPNLSFPLLRTKTNTSLLNFPAGNSENHQLPTKYKLFTSK